MMNNPLISFIAENLNRLFTKSPKFFKVWLWIAGLTSAITGLPGALATFGIILPSPWDITANKTVAIAATVAWFMAKLTTQSKIVDVSKDGTPLKETNVDKLPFTAQAEQKTLSNDLEK